MLDSTKDVPVTMDSKTTDDLAMSKSLGGKELVASAPSSLDDLEENTPEGKEPTELEMARLRHVSEKIPFSCWLVAIVELAERFAYYGLSTPFQNYMQGSPEDSPPGVLDLKNHGATGLSYFWQFWCYLTPVLGAYIADTWWGKYKTICWSCGVYFVGIVVLFVTSLPFNTKESSMGGFIVAIIIIGLGTGGVKSNVSPLIADQVPRTKPIIKVLKSGERVVQDPNITIQNVFMFFYLMINIGSLSVLATTNLEHQVDFWAAYLLPLCFFMIAPLVLWLGKSKYVKMPVGDKVISKCFKCVYVVMTNGFRFEAARPSLHPEADYPWTDQFVDEVSRAIFACKVFVFYPIFWVVYGQMVNNFVSMAGQMETHGMPNDMLQAINALTIIVFIPICERIVYPFIRRFTPFRAITRIFFGFMFSALSMVYAAVLQHYIYQAGPCYEYPKACAEEYRNTPNDISVVIQIPCYFLIGMLEILASITGLEYAYTKAPKTMKSFIMSLFLLTNAAGSALGIALSPTSQDPKLVWTYTGLAVLAFIAGWAFWFCFRHYNKREEEWNLMDFSDDEVEGLAPMRSMPESLTVK